MFKTKGFIIKCQPLAPYKNIHMTLMFHLKKPTHVAKGQLMFAAVFYVFYLGWFPVMRYTYTLQNKLTVFHHITMNERRSLYNKV